MDFDLVVGQAMGAGKDLGPTSSLTADVVFDSVVVELDDRVVPMGRAREPALVESSLDRFWDRSCRW